MNMLLLQKNTFYFYSNIILKFHHRSRETASLSGFSLYNPPKFYKSINMLHPINNSHLEKAEAANPWEVIYSGSYSNAKTDSFNGSTLDFSRYNYRWKRSNGQWTTLEVRLYPYMSSGAPVLWNTTFPDRGGVTTYPPDYMEMTEFPNYDTVNYVWFNSSTYYTIELERQLKNVAPIVSISTPTANQTVS